MGTGEAKTEGQKVNSICPKAGRGKRLELHAGRSRGRPRRCCKAVCSQTVQGDTGWAAGHRPEKPPAGTFPSRLEEFMTEGVQWALVVGRSKRPSSGLL